MEGYAKIASRMATYPELAIVRRFKRLSMQNILYLQAQLHHLEKQLHSLAQADIQSTSEQRKLYSQDWYTLSQSIESSDSLHKKDQWELVLQIREVLKEYSTLWAAASRL
jgi:hypothetical protein